MSTYNYKKFNYDNKNYLILKTSETYSKTASGKNWKAKPDEVTKEIVNSEHYTNYIQSVPFFNNFGDGAFCRAKFSYNAPGYLPTIVTSVSPYQETKIITTFEFVSIYTLKLNAGWREKEIINNAHTFNIKYINGSKMLYLYTNDTGVTASGIFDTKSNQWRN